jgi:hypothetical protein
MARLNKPIYHFAAGMVLLPSTIAVISAVIALIAD